MFVIKRESEREICWLRAFCWWQGDKKQAEELLGNSRKSGVTFKFWVSDKQENKLDYARATALLFTLNMVFGNSSDARLRTPMPQHAVA